MKRSQSEIIGLMVVMILLSLIMLFALRYCPGPPPPDSTDKELASGMIGAMLNTKSGCTKDTYIKDLLIDCAKDPVQVGTSELVCTDGRHSCAFAEESIQTILDRTLKVWQHEYKLEVWSPQDVEIMSFKNTLDGGVGNTMTARQPLPVATGQGSMEIILCIGTDKCPARHS
jgi:hypothetical protein